MFFFVLACAPFADLWALFAYVGVIGIATGHGQYFLIRAVKALSGERFDFIVRLFFGRDPRTDIKYLQYRDDNSVNLPTAVRDEIRQKMSDYGLSKLYWRGVFGMFVTGSFTGLFAAIVALCFDQYLIAFIFALTGVAKALAYMISDKIWNNTEGAEYINGGWRNAICLAVIGLLFL
jgi:hypothetical protein